jgi:hypothetical protein
VLEAKMFGKSLCANCCGDSLVSIG